VGDANAVHLLAACAGVRSAGQRTGLLHQWFPFELSSLSQILTEVELRVRHNPSWVLFARIATINKVHGGALAGVVRLIGASAQNLSAEITWVLVFPAFQRTYVTSNAIGI